MGKTKLTFILCIVIIGFFVFKVSPAWSFLFDDQGLNNSNLGNASAPAYIPHTNNSFNFSSGDNQVLQGYEDYFNDFVSEINVPSELSIVLSDKLNALLPSNDIISNISINENSLLIELSDPLETITLKGTEYDNLNIIALKVEYDSEEEALIISGISDTVQDEDEKPIFENNIFKEPKNIVAKEKDSDNEEIIENVEEIVIVNSEDEESVASAAASSDDDESEGEIKFYASSEESENEVLFSSSSTAHKIEEISDSSSSGSGGRFNSVSSSFPVADTYDPFSDLFNPLVPNNTSFPELLASGTSGNNTSPFTLASSTETAYTSDTAFNNDNINTVFESENITLKDVEVKVVSTNGKTRVLKGSVTTESEQESEIIVVSDSHQATILFESPLEIIPDESDGQISSEDGQNKMYVDKIDIIEDPETDSKIEMVYKTSKEEEKESNYLLDKDEESLATRSSKLKEGTLETKISNLFNNNELNISPGIVTIISEKIELNLPNVDYTENDLAFEIASSGNGNLVLNISAGQGRNIKIKITRGGKVVQTKTAKNAS